MGCAVAASCPGIGGPAAAGEGAGGAAGLATGPDSAAVGAGIAVWGGPDRACGAGGAALAGRAEVPPGEAGRIGPGSAGGGGAGRSIVAVDSCIWLSGAWCSISSENPTPKNTIMVAAAATPRAPRDKMAPPSWLARMKLAIVSPEGEIAVGRDAPNAAGCRSREPDRSRSVRLRMSLFPSANHRPIQPAQRIRDLQKRTASPSPRHLQPPKLRPTLGR
jgi:hypothetical protein